MNSKELGLLFTLAQQKGCKFTTLVYRSTESGELARHTLLFGADYKSAIEKDLRYLKRYKALKGSVKVSSLPGVPADVIASARLEFIAIDELIDGLQQSLAKYDGDQLKKAEEEKDVYTSVFPGVKQHKDTGVYYLWALGLRKKVIEPATKPKKTVKSRDLTIAKDRIRTKLRTNRYRQFRLSNIGKAVINGGTLVIE